MSDPKIVKKDAYMGIVKYLSNHPEEFVSSHELARRFGIETHTARKYAKRAEKVLGGRVESEPGLGYIWTPKYTYK